MNRKTRRLVKKVIRSLIIITGLAWFYLIYQSFSLPDTVSLSVSNPKTTSYIELYKKHNPKHKIERSWVPYEDISPNLKEAVVISEDDEFFEHPGFNLRAIRKAIEYNLKKGHKARGASTITQQLARNLYLSSNKSFLRKIRELFIAMQLERELSKQRILELYLNTVEWGDGIYGCEAAARHYFNKHASRLNRFESAYLAAILPSPRRLGKESPSKIPRVRFILERM